MKKFFKYLDKIMLVLLLLAIIGVLISSIGILNTMNKVLNEKDDKNNNNTSIVEVTASPEPTTTKDSEATEKPTPKPEKGSTTNTEITWEDTLKECNDLIDRLEPLRYDKYDLDTEYNPDDLQFQQFYYIEDATSNSIMIKEDGDVVKIDIKYEDVTVIYSKDETDPNLCIERDIPNERIDYSVILPVGMYKD